MPGNPPQLANLLVSMLIGFVILLVLIGGVLFWPISTRGLAVGKGDPSDSYEESMRRFAAIREREETLALHALGKSVILTHGEPTERVFVLLHGLTNSPQQFRKLGEMLFETGANVVMPRLAYHGLADRMNAEHGALGAEDLLAQAETGIDLATGLGREIAVVGLSVSGVSAAWVGLHRPEVESVFLFAPFFGPKGAPDFLARAAGRALTRLPNGFIWWDARQGENLVGPEYVYPRFATRQIGETLRLAAAIEGGPSRMLARRVGVVLSENDAAVNNARALRFVDRWKHSSPETEFFVHTFAAEENIPHDFIDPNQPDQQTDLVYPRLIEWLTRE